MAHTVPALITLTALGLYFLATFRFAYYRRVPRPFLAVAAAGPVIGLLRFAQAPGIGSGLGLLVAAALFGGICWFLFSYSVYAPREDRPRVGERFPDFRLPTSQGGTFGLADASGKRLMLLFYRGAWCPFCVTELGQLRDHYRDILARGVEVVAISVDPPEESEALRRRVGLDLRFLSDTAGSLMDVLGIRDRGGLPPPLVAGAHTRDRTSRDVFLATTFLLDEQGVIRWTYRPDSYRVRAPAAALLQAIDALDRTSAQEVAPAGATGTSSRSLVPSPLPSSTSSV